MESKDKVIGAVLIITGIAFIALGVWMGMPGLLKNNVSIYADANGSSNVSSEDLNVWNGLYNNGEISISLYRTAADTLEMSVNNSGRDDSSTTNVSLGTYSFKLDSASKLVYGGTDDTASITIERTEGGIVVQASSQDSEDILNKASGTYQREEYETHGWDGVYTYGDTTITLSEITSGKVYVGIVKGNSTYVRTVDEVTSEAINYEDTFFEETDKINIQKTTNGIIVTASTTDTDGMLNSISGTYTK